VNAFVSVVYAEKYTLHRQDFQNELLLSAMILKNVVIKNYRSIRKMRITFDPPCRILVGINESGKTNILDALNLLDPTTAMAPGDVREPGLHEDQVSEAYVRFVFKFTREEIDELTEAVKSEILSKSYSSPILKTEKHELTIDRFCETREGLYEVDVRENNKYVSHWGLDETQVMLNWKKVSDACPADFEVLIGDAEPVLLKAFALVDSSEYSQIPSEYLAAASADDLGKLATPWIEAKVAEELPTVLFWNYDEKNLLPSKVDLDKFCANPDTCIPLKRMFELYRISDIKGEIATARASGSNGLNNLLRRVAVRTSEHFHKTWQEYAGIKFSLSMNGPDLEAGIQDESNRYELSKRSDGFKRFVTFLLIVSAQQASNLLRNTLLLIDEPEIGLHPSGARYLMNELVDISRDNYVVFSTHSIFMIDRKLMNRHLIIKKENEITDAVEVSESNIQDEEVIYKALGHSIFSNLKERNLIFEGWRDKKLFETALTRVPAAQDRAKDLETVGRCFVHGVKQVPNVTPLFEAGSRKCLILTDSDAAAKEHQRKYQEAKGYGIWKRYDEILPNAALITGEDFVKETAFADAIDVASRKHGIAGLPATHLNHPQGKISALRRWLSQAGVPNDELNGTINAIKDSVFNNLRNSDIKPEYFDYLVNLVPIVESL